MSLLEIIKYRKKQFQLFKEVICIIKSLFCLVGTTRYNRAAAERQVLQITPQSLFDDLYPNSLFQ